jgi:hypothetical protein
MDGAPQVDQTRKTILGILRYPRRQGMNLLKELYQCEMELRDAGKKVKQALRDAFPDMCFCYHGHHDEPAYSFWFTGLDGHLDSSMFYINKQGECFLPKDACIEMISTKDRAWHEDMVAKFNAVINHE